MRINYMIKTTKRLLILSFTSVFSFISSHKYLYASVNILEYVLGMRGLLFSSLNGLMLYTIYYISIK